MRCRFCGDRAGWWRRRCADCRQLWTVWQAHRGAGMRRLLDAFSATGVANEKIGHFLGADLGGNEGNINDQIAADMANQLLDALGQRGTQRGADVRRLRQRGAWRHYDQRPEYATLTASDRAY